jgi:hypothetical protein
LLRISTKHRYDASKQQTNKIAQCYFGLSFSIASKEISKSSIF